MRGNPAPYAVVRGHLPPHNKKRMLVDVPSLMRTKKNEISTSMRYTVMPYYLLQRRLTV